MVALLLLVRVILSITALDAALTEASGEDRVAVTYAKAGVKVVVMDSDGNPVPQAKFWAGASGTGTATLNDLGWSGGKRDIFLSVNKGGFFHDCCERYERRRYCELYADNRYYR